MRQLVLSVFLFICFNALAQQDSVFRIPAYDTVYYDGYKNDRDCAIEKLRAIKDARAGKLQYVDVGIKPPRYKKYIARFCKPYNITYYYLPEERIGLEGFNAIRCYLAASDSMLKVKYGATIKDEINHKADSCFFANITKDTIDAKYCTKLASLNIAMVKSSAYGEVFHVTCDTLLYYRFKRLAGPLAEPMQFINLLIETDGTISNYHPYYFNAEGATSDTLKHIAEYNGCLEEFRQKALTYIKQYNKWQPAMVDTVPVRSWHSVEILIEPEQAVKK
jgi:hypothetical protein